MIPFAYSLIAISCINSEYLPTRKYWREKLEIDTPVDELIPLTIEDTYK
jgi:hypothetical protein